jgi:hypothetical protein
VHPNPEWVRDCLAWLGLIYLKERLRRGESIKGQYALALARLVLDPRVRHIVFWLVTQGPGRGFNGRIVTGVAMHLAAVGLEDQYSLQTPNQFRIERAQALEEAGLARAEAAAAELEGGVAKARKLLEKAADLEAWANQQGVRYVAVAPYRKRSPGEALALGIGLLVADGLKEGFGHEFTRVGAIFASAVTGTPITRDMVKRKFRYVPDWSRSSAQSTMRTKTKRAIR